MSSVVSALSGKTHVASIAVTEQGLRGMITLRGDLNASKLRNAATAASGVKFPDQGMCNSDGETGIAWMSPDEVLVMVAYDDVIPAIDDMERALGATHSLVANVSDARAVIRLEGEGIRDVMAKLSPVDMGPEAFQPGRFRRTRLAQIPAAFWMRDEQTLDLICFRSVADYAFDLLCRASMPGAEVGYTPV